MHFTMTGRKAAVNRFRVRYERQIRKQDPEGKISAETVWFSRGFPTREEADRFGERVNGQVEAVDVSDWEWMDGMTVPETGDPLGEAERILKLGKEKWEAECSAPTAEERIAMLEEGKAALESQLTDAQLALCDVYELLVGGEG